MASSEFYKLEGRLKGYLRRMERSNDITAEDKELIRDFIVSCSREGLSPATRSKYALSLVTLARWSKVGFRDFNRRAAEALVDQIQSYDCSEWTRHAHRVALKKFFKWLRGTEDYPEEVAWIKTSVSRRNNKLPEDLLTEDEILTMVDGCENLRDRAVLSFLWESGCRIGELLSLRVKHVSFDEDGYARVTIPEGKTGPRRLRCVSSAPHLNLWIQNHPLKGEREAPLWVGIGTVGRGPPLESGSYIFGGSTGGWGGGSPWSGIGEVVRYVG